MVVFVLPLLFTLLETPIRCSGVDCLLYIKIKKTPSRNRDFESLFPLGEFLSLYVRLEVYLQVCRSPLETMDLSPRQVAFVKSEMSSVQEDDARQPTARVEAERIAEEAEKSLTE